MGVIPQPPREHFEMHFAECWDELIHLKYHGGSWEISHINGHQSSIKGQVLLPNSGGHFSVKTWSMGAVSVLLCYYQKKKIATDIYILWLLPRPPNNNILIQASNKTDDLYSKTTTKILWPQICFMSFSTGILYWISLEMRKRS